MHDILVSTTVCLVCLIVALVSQVIAPSTVVAAAKSAEQSPAIESQPVVGRINQNRFELDPDDPNPSLFTMAPDSSSDLLSSGDGTSLPDSQIQAVASRITVSGLEITDLIVGEGAEASIGQTVKVHYRGMLKDGTQFDASYGRRPFSFPLGTGQVIQGWDEGLVGMKVGGKRRLVIPPELGYGSRGASNVIPPNAFLTFEVELLGVRN